MTDELPADDAALIHAGRRALRELPDAPEWRVLQAEAIWRPLPAQAAPLLARVLAVLSFDSWVSPAPALRGVPAEDSRQLLFAAADHDIDLRLASADGAWTIEGQVLGPDASGKVEIGREGDAQPQVTPLDELGAFRCSGLAPGTVRVVLILASVRIELPALQLGANVRDG